MLVDGPPLGGPDARSRCSAAPAPRIPGSWQELGRSRDRVRTRLPGRGRGPARARPVGDPGRSGTCQRRADRRRPGDHPRARAAGAGARPGLLIGCPDRAPAGRRASPFDPSARPREPVGRDRGSDARRDRRVADEARAVRLERDGMAAFVDEWEREPIFAQLRGPATGPSRATPGRSAFAIGRPGLPPACVGQGRGA